jgi:hypothetical protein
MSIRRYAFLQGANTIGLFTVLPAGCSASSLSAAIAANRPINTANAATAAKAARQAAMTARLTAVQPLLRTLLAEPPAAITVPGVLNIKAPVLWTGTRMALCYSLPPSYNVNPKRLALYVGPGLSGSSSADVLGPGTAPLSAAAKACVSISLPATIPTGTYTVGLRESSSRSVIASLTFSAGDASAFFSGAVNSAAAVTLVVGWTVDAPHASAADLLQVVDSAGGVAFWFYTACKCQTKPAAGARVAASGSVSFQLVKAGAVKGGYTPRLLPGGGSLAGRSGPNWIPWASFGL